MSMTAQANVGDAAFTLIQTAWDLISHSQDVLLRTVNPMAELAPGVLENNIVSVFFTFESSGKESHCLRNVNVAVIVRLL